MTEQPIPDPFDAEACVIGAGAAGLAAGAALAERDVSFAWFEKGSMVGGLWRIDNDNGGVAAYSTLHLNSSRPMSEYPSYPMPEDWPDYPSHKLVGQYFQQFAEDRGLLERITFNTEVTGVEPLPGVGMPGDNGWAVTTGDGKTTRYRYVLVANGHHSEPKVPTFSGTFSGETLHAHDYTDPSVFEDKDVLVVGVGNSGMDLTCDAVRSAHHVFASTRHGVHVIPKYLLGRPPDQLGSRFSAYIPFEVERTVQELLLRVSVGRPQDRGLPAPDHRLLDAHPSVSSEFLDRVGHGDIVVKPSIECLEGDKVRFVDGTVEHVDLLVYATGYDVTLPFLSPELLDPTGNRMPLYQRVVAPDLPGLFFLGYIQSVGSGIPLAAYQAEWVADLVTGVAALPSEEAMRRRIAEEEEQMQRRYVRSERHTMQVDYWRYIRTMKEERARRSEPSLLDRARALVAGLR